MLKKERDSNEQWKHFFLNPLESKALLVTKFPKISWKIHKLTLQRVVFSPLHVGDCPRCLSSDIETGPLRSFILEDLHRRISKVNLSKMGAMDGIGLNLQNDSWIKVFHAFQNFPWIPSKIRTTSRNDFLSSNIRNSRFSNFNTYIDIK